MNLRDLRYLVAVADHQHFGRAAESCFVSQPTLSTQLKKLEEELGVVLVERSNRQVMLSEVGRRVVAQARIVLREANEIQALAEQYRDPYGGDFRLGVIPTVAPYLLPKILPPVRKAFPNLRMQLSEGQTADISQRLADGELDAVLLALPLEDEHVVQRKLFSEPFYYAVPTAHPKANAKSVSVEDLENEQVLLLEDGHCLRDQALSVCERSGAVENTNFRATSLETLRQMVRANIGITLMPELAISKTAGVRYIPFRGANRELPHRDIGLCWRETSPRQPLLEELATLLESACG